MESDIKLVDLSKESLTTVKEAIKIASALGPSGFKFFVNKNFIKHGLVVTKIVPLTGDSAPKSQLILKFADLINLKKAVDFAKKVLVNDGEAIVEEKSEPVIHATSSLEEIAEETSTETPTTTEPAAEEPKKRTRKKTVSNDTENSEITTLAKENE